MKKISFIIFLVLFSNFYSQDNINSTILETNWGGDSEPDHLTMVGNKLFFSAKIASFYDGNGRELWVKDSPSSKSRIVKDINSGGNGIEAGSNFINFNGLLLFTGSSSNGNYRQLWRSDGTSDGTYFLKTINPNYDAYINNPTILGDKLYFSASVNNSSELWVTDGTSDGTYLLKKINSSGNSNVDNLFIFHNQIYFTATDNIHGNELWKTDGTEAGTEIVKDFFPGSVSGVTNKPIVYKDNLIFMGKQSNNLFGLWKWDFVNNEFILIKPFTETYSYSFKTLELQDNIYFIYVSNYYTGNLWKTDGTPENTKQITTGDLENKISQEKFLKFKNKLYFNSMNSNFESKVLVLDSTDDIPKELGSIIPVLNNAYLQTISSKENYMFFKKGDNNSFVTDGTLIGTKEIYDIKAITNYTGFSFNFLEYDNNLVMNAETPENGVELYKYNFEDDKTELVEDLHHVFGNNYISSEILNGKLIYFGSDYNHGLEVFTSDGTKEGTHVVKDLNPGNSGIVYSGDNPRFFKHNNKLFFRCSDGTGYEPCITDGTEEGTRILKNISHFDQSVNVDPYFLKFNEEVVLFGADNGTNNTASASNLWRTDGTESGTYQLSLLNIVLPNYAFLNNKVFYTTYNNLVKTYTYSIAETDGTSLNTKLFKTFYDENGQNVVPYILGSTNNRMLYLYRNSNSIFASEPYHLYSSDGINSLNDIKLANVSNMFLGSVLSTTFNNKIYFYAAFAGDNYYRLYSSDGTLQGTKSVSNILNGNVPLNIEYTKCGNKLYVKSENKIFVLDENDNMAQLTDEPTSSFKSLKCLSNNIFFMDRKYEDNKIWMSNGTLEGTKPLNLFVNNIAIVGTSYLNDITVTDSQLFFIASFSQTPELRNSGTELYIADISNLNLNTSDINVFAVPKEKSFIVYPNPISDTFNILNMKNRDIQSIDLLNFNAQILRKWGNSQLDNFNIEQIPSGVYSLLIKTKSGESELHKIIKH